MVVFYYLKIGKFANLHFLNAPTKENTVVLLLSLQCSIQSISSSLDSDILNCFDSSFILACDTKKIQTVVHLPYPAYFESETDVLVINGIFTGVFISNFYNSVDLRFFLDKLREKLSALESMFVFID